jgi:hypothetical protein
MGQGESTQGKSEMKVEDKPPVRLARSLALLGTCRFAVPFCFARSIQARCSQKSTTIRFSSDPEKCKEDVETQPMTSTGRRRPWMDEAEAE